MGFLRPRKLDKARIAARVAAAPDPERTPNVVPLNADFFKLEQMRRDNTRAARKLRG
jgi:hypothetical protein